MTKDIPMEKSIMVSAPINIALLKYWGKKDELMIIPMNNSISLTLDQHNIKSTTFLKISTNISENSISINDRQAIVSGRINSMFAYALSKSHVDSDQREKIKFEIRSVNNFPTAAGMASSASGMAALAFALGQVLELSDKDISILARLGSGSATRSVFGGIVEWRGDEKDSRSFQLHSEEYWPQLRVLICIVSRSEKKVSSTSGMQTSVATSQLLRYRYAHCVEENRSQILRALKERNFSELATVTMRESNQLHAVCLDTEPPIMYLNSSSFSIIDFVSAFNATLGYKKLAYTFDAGPNAFLLYEEADESVLRYALQQSFGVTWPKSVESSDIADDTTKRFEERLPRSHGAIEALIATKVGPGPRVCLS